MKVNEITWPNRNCLTGVKSRRDRKMLEIAWKDEKCSEVAWSEGNGRSSDRVAGVERASIPLSCLFN